MKPTIIRLGDAEDMFKDYLDDVYEPYTLGFGTFYPSQILQDCDPIAYRMGLGEFMDNLVESSNMYVESYNDNEIPEDEEDEE